MNLERELRSLQVDWPETPALRPELAPRRRGWRRPLVLALAVLVLALAVAFAVAPARSAILRFFHLGGVTIERVETLPGATRRSLAAGLGPELPLAEAVRVAGFVPWLPAGVEVARAYARPGLIAVLLDGGRLLTELVPGDFGMSKKFASEATRVEWLRVGTDVALWLEGGPHVLVYRNANGFLYSRTLRLAGNTLIWQHGSRTLRVEGPLTKAQALRIAESIRPDRT